MKLLNGKFLFSLIAALLLNGCQSNPASLRVMHERFICYDANRKGSLAISGDYVNKHGFLIYTANASAIATDRELVADVQNFNGMLHLTLSEGDYFVYYISNNNWCKEPFTIERDRTYYLSICSPK